MDEIIESLAVLIELVEAWRPDDSREYALSRLSGGYKALFRASHHLRAADFQLCDARDLLVPKLKQEMEAGERQRPTDNVYTHLKQQLDALAKESGRG